MGALPATLLSLNLTVLNCGPTFTATAIAWQRVLEETSAMVLLRHKNDFSVASGYLSLLCGGFWP